MSEKQLSDLTDDELKGLVETGEFPETQAADPEPESEAEPEVQQEEPSEEAKPEENTPDPLEKMQLEIERLKIMAEKADHYRLMHDKLSGQYGDLNRRFKDLQRRNESGDTASYASDEIETIRTELSELREADKRRRKEEASRAVYEEAQTFQSKFPDAGEYAERIKEQLSQRYSLIQEALETGDPDVARSITRDVVREAYFSARESALQDKIKEAEAKRADAAKTLKERKTAATMSAQGGQRVAQAARPVGLKDLSDDDLRRLVDEVSGP